MRNYSWKKELDALVEQALAMTKSVKGTSVQTKPEFDPKAALESSIASVEQVLGTERQRPQPASSERKAIQQRVANFRAHQQKLQNEREEYFMRTMAQARAAMLSRPSTAPKN